MLITLLLICPILFSFLYQLCFVENLKLSYFTTRSKCDYCRKQITIIETIPILSFIFLKGTSRCCHRRISVFYLFGELLSLTPVFYLLYLPHKLMIDHTTLILIYLFLLTFSIFDIKTYTVPLHVVVVFAICICFITPIHIMPFFYVTEFLITLLFTFICGGVFALLVLLISRNERARIPLIPFIYIAFNIMLLTSQNLNFGGFS